MDDGKLLLWAELATAGMVTAICLYFWLAGGGHVRPPLRSRDPEAEAAWVRQHGPTLRRWSAILLVANLLLMVVILVRLRG
ncbi:MAG TPA: hypothetical protein PKD86_09905 [Gemmatales bacterium]|nr:hypothetical protein [Gemmatales bacterium]HMP59656.1 hypothetical protein [Gemmatales bacterium]